MADEALQTIGFEEECSVLVLPVVLTGLFRDLLKEHFSSPDLIEHPLLKKLIWTDAPSTELLIETGTRFDPRTAQRRPAIIIRRGAYENQRLGAFGERHQLPPMDRDGTLHFSTFWQGSHTFQCIGGTALQAEYLASEVQRFLHHFAYIHAPELQLLRFEVKQVGETTKMEEWGNHFLIPVLAQYFFEDAWSLRPTAPILKRFSLYSILDQ